MVRIHDRHSVLGTTLSPECTLCNIPLVLCNTMNHFKMASEPLVLTLAQLIEVCAFPPFHPLLRIPWKVPSTSSPQVTKRYQPLFELSDNFKY